MDYFINKAKLLLNVASEVAVAFFVVIIVAFLLSWLETTITQPTAHAASLKGYESMPISMTGSGGKITMRPDEKKDVYVTFQNIGQNEWKNDGVGYISVYTYDPKYRRSDFDPGTWLGPEQVKRISEVSVPVGSVGTVGFELHAPEEEGQYTETFHLASEEIA